MKLKKHILYYALLLGILIFGLVSVLRLKGEESAQLVVFSIVTVCYIIVGIIHHKTEHDLHTKIVIEYFLMGLLGIAIMFFLLQ